MKANRHSKISSILIVLMISILANQIVRPAIPDPVLREEVKEAILANALQIVVFSADGATFEQGIGSMFHYAGETLILTHNHWTKITDFAKVVIRSAQNVLLLEISGREFFTSVYYRDQGSIIIKAPAGLSLQSNADVASLPDLQVKDELVLVHQSKLEPGKLDVMLVQIQTPISDQGVSTYKINVQNGKKINPGDSGGGLWYNGQLVGNTWAYYHEADATQIGIVAQLPVHYLENYLAIYKIEKNGTDGTGLKVGDKEVQLQRGENK